MSAAGGDLQSISAAVGVGFPGLSLCCSGRGHERPFQLECASGICQASSLVTPSRDLQRCLAQRAERIQAGKQGKF